MKKVKYFVSKDLIYRNLQEHPLLLILKSCWEEHSFLILITKVLYISSEYILILEIASIYSSDLADIVLTAFVLSSVTISHNIEYIFYRSWKQTSFQSSLSL